MKFDPHKVATIAEFLREKMGEVSCSVNQDGIQYHMPHGIFLWQTSEGLRTNVETSKGVYYTNVEAAFVTIREHLQKKMDELTTLPCMQPDPDLLRMPKVVSE